MTDLLKAESESSESFKSRTLAYFGDLQNVVKALLSSELPTVAIVGGASPAGGTVLALSCDYRISPTLIPNNGPYMMGLNEVAVGMSPPLFVHHLARFALPSLRVADKAVMTGRLVNSPQEALDAGFVDELVEGDHLEQHAVGWIMKMNKLPWRARAEAKISSRKHILETLDDASLESIYDCIAGQEFQNVCKELLEALKKKRKQ